MRITKDTTYKILAELRKSFAPRWDTEAAKIRLARATLIGEELEKAEQAYADFETVASAVIAITDLRKDADQLFYEDVAALVQGSGPVATAELTPEERDRRAQGSYSGPDMTPGGGGDRAPTQAEIFNRLADELKADFHDLLKKKVKPEIEAAYHFALQRNWKQSLHMMEHAVDYILQILRRYDPENMSQLSEERKKAFMSLQHQEVMQKMRNDCRGINLAVECANENSGFQNGFKKNPPHNTRSGRFRTEFPHIDIVKRPFDYVNTPAH